MRVLLMAVLIILCGCGVKKREVYTTTCHQQGTQQLCVTERSVESE